MTTMTTDWAPIYKSLDAMRYAVQQRIRRLFGEGRPDEAHLVNSFCLQIWHAAERYALHHQVFVQGADDLTEADYDAEHYRPPETNSPRVLEMERRLKEVIGDLVEEDDDAAETEDEDDEDDREDPWQRPDQWEQ